MLSVVTVIENSFVKIAWQYPNDNSDTVVEYEILIRQGDMKTFTPQLLYCDGRSAAIVQKLYCLVPMSTLRAEPYSLKFKDYVFAKIKAKNALGWSPYSDLNSMETQIQIEPGTGNLVRRGSQTSTTRIEVVWDAMTTSSETGDSPIRSYNLEWD